MNQATQSVIEFLSHPELNFGTEEDLLLLDEPTELAAEVARLLQNQNAFFDAAQTEELQNQLPQVDWNEVAQEFRNRVQMTARFFDGDAQTHKE